MSIDNYQNMLNKVSNKILSGLKYKNTIIIGDNSSGKSELLKILVEKYNGECYFIDSINRYFDIEQIANFELDNKSYNYINISEARIAENHFNIKDSFDFDCTGTGAIEKFYFVFEKELLSLFKQFLNLDFYVEFVNRGIVAEKPAAYIENTECKISSGFQAIIRLFLELLYFEKSLNLLKKTSGIVIIDELNEFLSIKNESKIFNFIMEKFPKFNFIITTHSADIIANSVDCNIVALTSDNDYEYFDGNDYTTITDVREVFNEILNMENLSSLNEDDIILRKLLNSKINGLWSDDEQKVFDNMTNKKELLSTTQQLILNQIDTW